MHVWNKNQNKHIQFLHFAEFFPDTWGKYVRWNLVMNWGRLKLDFWLRHQGRPYPSWLIERDVYSRKHTKNDACQDDSVTESFRRSLFVQMVCHKSAFCEQQIYIKQLLFNHYWITRSCYENELLSLDENQLKKDRSNGHSKSTKTREKPVEKWTYVDLWVHTYFGCSHKW